MGLYPELVDAIMASASGTDAVTFLTATREHTGSLGLIQQIATLRHALEPIGLRDALDAVHWTPSNGADPLNALLAPYLPGAGDWTPLPQPWTAGVPETCPLPPTWPREWSSAERADIAVLGDWLRARGDDRGSVVHQAEWAARLGVDAVGLWALATLPHGTMRMRWVPGGVFQRGRPESRGAMRAHSVRLTRGFWMAETLLIADSLEQGRVQPAVGEARLAAYCLTWPMAQSIIEQVQASVPARLPTEAEWECACRAGTATETWLGNLSSMTPEVTEAHFAPIDDGESVATRAPNPLGLFDMIGCAHEWVIDGFAAYSGDATDPIGQGLDRVRRGRTADGRMRSNQVDSTAGVRIVVAG